MRGGNERTSTRLRTHAATTAVLLALCLACASPTVNIATQKPIEIRIDLRHELRIQLDRDVSELIDTEGAQALTVRSISEDAERVRQGKASGTLGERADGYLGVRSTEPAELDTALVDRVNASRRLRYQALAAEESLSPEDVAKLAGASRIRAALPGESIQTPGGDWIVKDEHTTIVVTDETDA